MWRKLGIAMLTVAMLGALAVGGLASGAIAAGSRPKPYAYYYDKWVTLQADKTGTHLSTILGYCTPSKNWKFSFSVPPPGPSVSKSGRFHWSKGNAVNTPDGGTLLKKSKVTVDGKFISPCGARRSQWPWSCRLRDRQVRRQDVEVNSTV